MSEGFRPKPGGWEDSGKKYEQHMWEFAREYLSQLGVSITTETKVLEIGSGRGFALEAMRDAGIDAVGIDKRPRVETPGMYVAARIEALPFQDETFDLVYGNNVFDSTVYDSDQQEMYTEILRVLRSGGVLLITDSRHVAEPQMLEFVKVSGPEHFVFKAYQKVDLKRIQK